MKVHDVHAHTPDKNFKNIDPFSVIPIVRWKIGDLPPSGNGQQVAFPQYSLRHKPSYGRKI